MKRSFKEGDAVFYSAIRGIIVGIFNSDQALFYANEQREGFQTRDEITSVKRGSSKIIDYLIKEHFGYRRTPIHTVLDQHRFAILSLQDLKHMSSSQIQADKDRLVRQRHLYLRMARGYVLNHRSDDQVHRICKRVEDIQAEIELEVVAANYRKAGICLV